MGVFVLVIIYPTVLEMLVERPDRKCSGYVIALLWISVIANIKVRIKDILKDQYFARHFVYYVECLSSPPSFLCSQIITPFLHSMISTNQKRGLNFSQLWNPYSNFFCVNIPSFRIRQIYKNKFLALLLRFYIIILLIMEFYYSKRCWLISHLTFGVLMRF